MHLTIAIPTYNRNDILLNTIKHLLPQLTNECDLLVIDNSSDTPVETTLQPLLSLYGAAKIKIVRNKVNIGGNANIIRCIEYAEGDYVWILGDDDIPLPNAISVVLSNIKSCPDFISFYSPHPQHSVRTHDAFGEGISSLLESLDSFGNFIFVSNMVVNCTKARLGLRYAYHCTGSGGPHVALMLWMAAKGGSWVLSSQSLVDKGEPEQDQMFSILPVVRGLPALAWVLDGQFRQDFRRNLLGATRVWLTPRGVAAQLILTESGSACWFSIDSFREYNIIRRLWHVGFSVGLSNLRWSLWSLPLLSPRLARLGLEMVSRRRGVPMVKTNADREI